MAAVGEEGQDNVETIEIFPIDEALEKELDKQEQNDLQGNHAIDVHLELDNSTEAPRKKKRSSKYKTNRSYTDAKLDTELVLL